MLSKGLFIKYSDHQQAIFNLGVLYRKINNLEKSSEFSAQSIDINPIVDAGVLFLPWGSFYLKGQKHNNAVDMFQNALELGYSKEHCYFNGWQRLFF
ncbi:MAG: hypothetical protein MZU97_02200 [Bacillus subtilis]|nr:hypothetical protein [Bacillus subtilis]